ncbi:MAG: hypothetical protein MNPFHGCM_01345 [Gemmatimonadaceae bacterium]|nr:hypothetical protein [Gemmatimonadaceae bacterium]
MERVILRHLKGSKASQLEEFPLQQFVELTIGRDPASGIRFDPEKDDLVGRQHARITRDKVEPYRFKLQDMNSRNGTFLNKLRVVGEMPLQPGDVIQLGAGGPELQFDLDPLPSIYVKATRLGVAGPAGATVQGVAETRISSTSPAAGSVSGAASAPAAPNAIGKATVERMIGETKSRSNRNIMLVGAAALVAVVSAAAWARKAADDRAKEAERAAAQQIGQVQQAAQESADSLSRALGRAGDLAKMLTPAEIAEKYASATVQIDFSWNLIYAPTGAQVFHAHVANRMKLKSGRVVAIIPNGPASIPAYIDVGDNTLEPKLTVDPANGAPIAVTGSGSGFVTTSDGFIVTNRHVAANWRSRYHFDRNDAGVLVDGDGRIVLDNANNAILVNPPGNWIPAETKQYGPKRELDVFRGRQEYLMVRFRKNTNPAEATTQRVSDRHDVALIKVTTPATLNKVQLFDSYSTSKVGDQVIVMGYPAVSDNVYAVLKSKDMFNRDAQARVIPDPTLSVGNIGKILRASDGPATDQYFSFAPNGDTYQLTINSTGAGNSGGPMFDAYGRVVGIYFAGKTMDAQISFSVPIRYALELMSVDPNTK